MRMVKFSKMYRRGMRKTASKNRFGKRIVESKPLIAGFK